MTPTEPAAEAPRSQRLRWLIPGLIALVFIVLIRTAWLSEDAYFTFRSVENWVLGYGARWNVGERVQVYTHPLWFGLTSLLFFVTRNMPVAAFTLGFLCTAGTIYMLVRRLATSRAGAAMALAILIGSKAFVDYSTSGLENPLSHLLLLGFFAGFFIDEDPDPRGDQRRLFATAAFGGLLVCNRMDLGLILAPALVYALWPPRSSIRRVLAVALGFAPLLVWELISLVYYGFLLPNTAYAKLGAGAAPDSALVQGLRYFKNSLEWDPITLISVGVICLASLRQLRARPKQACAALGVLLYLAYVLRIGGDYMSGRFFSAPLIVAAGLLANHPRLRKPTIRVGAVVIVCLALMAPNPTLLCGRDYHRQRLRSADRIDDERGYRHLHAGLLSEREGEFLRGDPWYRRGLAAREQAEAKREPLVLVHPNGGYMGYAAGPSVHYINPYAITDPLLARLPGGYQGPGHYWRHPPPGYTRAAIGAGELRDPELAAYWAELSLIISGPIWSRQRWAAIWRMHTGANQELLDAYLHARLRYAQVSDPDAAPLALRRGGAMIMLDGVRHEPLIEIHVELDDVYELELVRAGERVYRRSFGQVREQRKNRLAPYQIKLPAKAVDEGYDEIRVNPIRGDGLYRMGQVRLLSDE